MHACIYYNFYSFSASVTCSQSALYIKKKKSGANLNFKTQPLCVE